MCYSTLLQCVSILLFLPLSLAYLSMHIIDLFILGVSTYNITMDQILQIFSAALTEGKLAEGILFTKRLLILMIIIDFMVKVPIIGVCWFFDQIFYPSYHKCEIKDPSFSYLLVAMAPQSWQAIKKMKKKTF